MSDPSPRFREIVCEVDEDLPRQGPDHRACAARALGLCHERPGSPAILDLLSRELEMHRRDADDDAYPFFVARHP
jgi:hypothetical protein